MLDLQPLPTHETQWRPSDVTVALNVALDACIVPTADGSGARVDCAHVVVLDNFFGEAERSGLLDFITEPGACQACMPCVMGERVGGWVGGGVERWGWG